MQTKRLVLIGCGGALILAAAAGLKLASLYRHDRTVAKAVASLTLPAGAKARLLPGPIPGTAGYEVDLGSFPSSRPCNRTCVISGLPTDTGNVMLYMRVPHREDRDHTASTAVMTASLRVGDRKVALASKIADMTAMSGWPDPEHDYLYVWPAPHVRLAPNEGPVEVEFQYSPGESDAIDGSIDLLISSGGTK